MAAILAADVVGYTRLVGDDEEDTLRRLETYKATFNDFITRFGGRVFSSAGDAILAEFKSAVDAVRCAIDVQESLRTRNLAYPANRQMPFRIGITIGDIVERDGDLLGEGVNIAARLEGIAPPGGICISRSVHEAVADKISLKFEDAGQQQLRNIPEPVHAYTVSLDTRASISPPVGKVPGANSARYNRIMMASTFIVLAAMGLSRLLKSETPEPHPNVARLAEESRPTAETVAPQHVRVETPDAQAPATSAAEDPQPTNEVSDGDACADATKEDPAIAACSRLLEASGLSKSGKSTLLINRGAAYLNKGQYDAALTDLNEALTLTPNDEVAFYNRGATYFFKDQYDAAVEDLKRSAKLQPKHVKTQYYLGRTMHSLSRYDEALAYFNRAISLDATYTDAWRFRGDTLLDKGQYADAIPEYNEAVRLDPNYGQAYRGRGITRYSQERLVEAVEDLSEAIRLDAQDWYALQMRSQVYVQQKKYDDAVTDVSAALAIEPENAVLFNARADALVKGGKPDAAMVDVGQALRIDPNFAVAMTTRGEIHEALGNKSDAIADFKKALELDGAIEDAKAGLRHLGEMAAAKETDTKTAAKPVGERTCSKFLASIGTTISVPCPN